MFSGKQYGVLGVIVGANLLLSLLVSTIGGSLGAQGPTGNTGPQGPQGSTGETGQAGREVEFSVQNNVLVWRYVGDTQWRELDLDISSGGGSTVNSGGFGYFSHWMYDLQPSFNFDYPSRIIVDNSATYAANLIANEGFTGVSSLAQLEAIGTDEASLAGKYVLTSDIDLTAWVPTGSTNVIPGDFEGIFDGAGYEIANMTIDEPGNFTENSGLFYSLRGATVRNLDLTKFAFTADDIRSSGALASRAERYNDQPVVIDQVNLLDFKVEANSNIQRVGGLFGYGQGHIKLLRSSTADIDFKTDGNMFSAGGMFGRMDYDSTVEMYELNSQLETGLLTVNGSGNFGGGLSGGGGIGGLGGDFRAGATIFAYEINSQLVGYVRNHSSGFVGNVAGYSKVILNNMNVIVDIQNIFGYDGYNVGGLFGFYGRDGILFIDNVSTSGSIFSYSSTGGFIGYAREESVVKITNSSSEVDITSNYYVGGIVGRIDDDEHKWMISNVTVDATLTPYQDVANYEYSYSQYFGGLIGYIDDRDSGNFADSNQVLIQDVNVNVVFSMSVSDRSELSNLYYNLSYVGGLIGYVSDDNQIRLVNIEVNSEVLFEIDGFVKSQYLGSYFERYGGLVGYTSDSDILVIDVDSTFVFNYAFQNFAPETLVGNNVYLSITDLGGAFGEIDSGQITMVASTFVFDVTYTIENLTSTNYSYNIDFYDVGGLVGHLDDDAVLLTEDLSVEMTMSILVKDIVVGTDGPQFSLEILRIGGLIGRAEGVAIFKNVTRSFVSEVDVIDNVVDRVDIILSDLTKDLGTSNPFVFFN